MSTSKLTIPLTLLREAIGHVVQVELDSKDTYKGTLTQADGKMNCTLTKVAHTAAEGKVGRVEEVFLKGSAIRMFLLPTALAQAPVLRQVKPEVMTSGGGGTGSKRVAGGAAPGTRPAKKQRT